MPPRFTASHTGPNKLSPMDIELPVHNLAHSVLSSTHGTCGSLIKCFESPWEWVWYWKCLKAVIKYFVNSFLAQLPRFKAHESFRLFLTHKFDLSRNTFYPWLLKHNNNLYFLESSTVSSFPISLSLLLHRNTGSSSPFKRGCWFRMEKPVSWHSVKVEFYKSWILKYMGCDILMIWFFFWLEEKYRTLWETDNTVSYTLHFIRTADKDWTKKKKKIHQRGEVIWLVPNLLLAQGLPWAIPSIFQRQNPVRQPCNLEIVL